MISMISNLSDLSLPNAGAQDQSVAARPVYVSVSCVIRCNGGLIIQYNYGKKGAGTLRDTQSPGGQPDRKGWSTWGWEGQQREIGPGDIKMDC
jgi:hypothetical protein